MYYIVHKFPICEKCPFWSSSIWLQLLQNHRLQEEEERHCGKGVAVCISMHQNPIEIHLKFLLGPFSFIFELPIDSVFGQKCLFPPRPHPLHLVRFFTNYFTDFRPQSNQIFYSESLQKRFFFAFFSYQHVTQMKTLCIYEL